MSVLVTDGMMDRAKLYTHSSLKQGFINSCFGVKTANITVSMVEQKIMFLQGVQNCCYSVIGLNHSGSEVTFSMRFFSSSLR